MNANRDERTEPIALLASLLSLMTGYARTGCSRQAVFIERQLDYLQSYPDDRVPPTLKAVARRLGREWEEIRRQGPPVAAASQTLH